MADPVMCNSLCSWVNNIVLKSSYPLSKVDFFCNPDPKKDQFITPFGRGGLMGLPSTLPSTKLFWIVQVLKIGTCYDI